MAKIKIRNGFSENELPTVERKLGNLPRRLDAFSKTDALLEIGIKDRDRESQRITLEYRNTGRKPSLIATSNKADLTQALHEVRVDMTRQLNDIESQRPSRHRIHRPL